MNTTKQTQAIFYNNNPAAIQRMLDYDFLIGRKISSVAAIIHTTSGAKFSKVFFGSKEIIIPIYKDLDHACLDFPDVSILINFASERSAAIVSSQALEIPQIKTILIFAEGIPERWSRELGQKAKSLDKKIVGPASIGFIYPGFFKTANIGGTIENIISSKLTRAGSAGLVSRSGGMFNELAGICAKYGDGLAMGVAIGGDRFAGSLFLDQLLEMQDNENVKYMVMLGEIGGTAEYQVIEAVKSGKLTKPLVAWCIGTVAENLESSIQFGHAGASANSKDESAKSKNQAMKEVGILVPESFEGLPGLIKNLHLELQDQGKIKQIDEPILNPVPVDLKQAIKRGLVRQPTHFISTIGSDKGGEAHYFDQPISNLATPETGYGIGDVISLLWFKSHYPKWASEFLETVIKTVADHGPLVSGAHNARVTARAGKDLVSSLASGLLTIGPRFGGAIDGAAKYFKYGFDQKMTAQEFVGFMKKENLLIPGIGHKVKSVRNPDLRVKKLLEYAKNNFKQTPILDFALEVEKITTSKKENLILNVDGAIACLMVDMWILLEIESKEIDQYIANGSLNAFFVLGRSIGFIGHILDENRLQMGLYRHPDEDVLYIDFQNLTGPLRMSKSVN